MSLNKGDLLYIPSNSTLFLYNIDNSSQYPRKVYFVSKPFHAIIVNIFEDNSYQIFFRNEIWNTKLKTI